MSQPLLDLQRILSGKRETAGKVLSVSDGLAKVATSTGVAGIAHDGVFGVGDRVTIRAGSATRVQDAATVPTFFV
ncbi:MAG: hypothetical protein HQL88_07275 [Magnetococcales bacterium]|nr:hypothetical protein [Magnetococcales bacterium]